jgi:nitrous oxidase accessory protein
MIRSSSKHEFFFAAACFAAALRMLLPCSAAATALLVRSDSEQLSHVLEAASAGDVIELQAGFYSGPIVVDRQLTIVGRPGAVIDGHGRGDTIKISAPNVTIRGLIVRGSGIDDPMDAGIFLDDKATAATIENNRIVGNLVGVFDHGAARAMIRNNVIVGRSDLRLNERGNGVYVWNAPGTQVIGNDISGGRDGIFTNTSRQNVFRRNRMHDVRFGVHYMYTNDSEVSENVSTGNHAGYVIMFSNRLQIRENVSINDRDHALLFNYANESKVEGNIAEGSQECVFIYNANKNIFLNNRFQDCEIGVHFTAGSERNAISGNAFIGNHTQVKYVGTRSLDWSVNGRGNYWSDNPAFDLNGDGIADAAYRPNDLVDRVMWAYSEAKLLLNSPAIQILRWAQSQFPALHPGGVIDSAPLMSPAPVPARRERAELQNDGGG